MDIKKLIPDLEIRTKVGPFIDEEWYFSLGKEQAEKVIRELTIKANDKILDLGCGCGRIAIHFLDYLNDKGEYIGIDNNKKLLSYCENNIAILKDNFKFKYIDVYNGAYSKEGSISPKEVVFPLEDESVDVVIMHSVFTHMFIGDINAYLKEVHRVLKKGGKLVASLNLSNEFTQNQIKMDNSNLNIKYKVDDNSFTLDKKIPESGFAHNEEKIKELYWKIGFFIKKIEYGVWASKELTGEFHDYIFSQKVVK